MKANAWHHRADAVSSVVALIGVGKGLILLKVAQFGCLIGFSIILISILWYLLHKKMNLYSRPLSLYPK